MNRDSGTETPSVILIDWLFMVIFNRPRHLGFPGAHRASLTRFLEPSFSSVV